MVSFCSLTPSFNNPLARPPALLPAAAMVSFCNPGVLGTPAQFRRHFEAPILAGREPGEQQEVYGCP